MTQMTAEPITLANLLWKAHRAAAPHSSPLWAATDRGWLLAPGQPTSLGFYLDYGPDHYRSGHEWCRAGACDCRLTQPGNILAVVVDRPGVPRQSRYVPTVADAEAWILERQMLTTPTAEI